VRDHQWDLEQKIPRGGAGRGIVSQEDVEPIEEVDDDIEEDEARENGEEQRKKLADDVAAGDREGAVAGDAHRQLAGRTVPVRTALQAR
jgi:hypothetical protein